MTSLPLISILLFLPAASAGLLLLFPSERKQAVRLFALAVSAIALVLSAVAYFSYDQAAGGYQLQEFVPWIPRWGIGYHVGVNGISLPLVLLTGIVMFTGVLISWGIDDRPREFFAFLFLLATGVYGVFVSLDLFLLFF
jgi:NADH-quinone oxidoreductase subunit M